MYSWLSDRNNFPLGLKYKNSDTYIEFIVYPEHSNAMLRVIDVVKIDESIELLKPILERMITEYGIKGIYQIVPKEDFQKLVKSVWEKYIQEISTIEVANNKMIIGCDINRFLEIFVSGVVN